MKISVPYLSYAKRKWLGMSGAVLMAAVLFLILAVTSQIWPGIVLVVLLLVVGFFKSKQDATYQITDVEITSGILNLQYYDCDTLYQIIAPTSDFTAQIDHRGRKPPAIFLVISHRDFAIEQGERDGWTREMMRQVTAQF